MAGRTCSSLLLTGIAAMLLVGTTACVDENPAPEPTVTVTESPQGSTGGERREERREGGHSDGRPHGGGHASTTTTRATTLTSPPPFDPNKCPAGLVC